MLYYLLVGAYILVCGLLLVVVLLQQGKGGDIAAGFGGVSSQTAFGARSGATVLTRATWILGGLFMAGALGLAVLGRHAGSGSVVGDVSAPTNAAPAAPSLPTAAPLPTTAPPPAAAPKTPDKNQNKTTPPAPPTRGGRGGI